MSNKAGRVVLITGAAGGIGGAIARRFAAEGDRLILIDIDPRVNDMAPSLGAAQSDARGFVVDLGEETQILAMLDKVKEQHGGCDVLVNCAAALPKYNNGVPAELHEVSTAGWNRIMQINVTAPFILCRELLPGMKERGFGRVVNVGSITGQMYRSRAAIDYSTSKAALMGLTRRLAGAYAPYGITINSVAPGRIQTAMTAVSVSEAAAIARATIPMQRPGTPDEVASAVCYLASSGASFITGTSLDVNGGDYMN